MSTAYHTTVNKSVSPPGIIVHRHGAYPEVLLEESIVRLREVYTKFPGNRFFTADDVVEVLRDAVTAAAIISAAVHYGMIKKYYRLYHFTRLFRSFQESSSAVVQQKYLLQLFGHPTLYRKIIQKYDARPLPADIKSPLVRFFRVPIKAAPAVADAFLSNAIFAGALEAGVLQYKNTLAGFDQHVETEQHATPAQIELKLPGNRTAILQHPGGLTSRDIDILQKQIAELARFA